MKLQKRLGSANFCDWQTQRFQIYDYVRLNPLGTNQISFFNAPIGTVDPVSLAVKNLEQTNVQKSRSFGQMYFICDSIKTHIHFLPKVRQSAELSADALVASTATAGMQMLRGLIQSGVLNIKLGAKDYFDIPTPFRFCPPGFGVDVQQYAAPLVGVAQLTRQSNNPADVYRLTPEQLIEPEQTIEATIDFYVGNTPNFDALADTPLFNVGLILDGWVARPMQ